MRKTFASVLFLGLMGCVSTLHAASSDGAEMARIQAEQDREERVKVNAQWIQDFSQKNCPNFYATISGNQSLLVQSLDAFDRPGKPGYKVRIHSVDRLKSLLAYSDHRYKNTKRTFHMGYMSKSTDDKNNIVKIYEFLSPLMQCVAQNSTRQ